VACYHPITAYTTASEGVVFAQLGRHDITGTIQLPCRGCIGCRMDRAADWAVRLGHEAQMHKEKSWITLTYRDDPITLSVRDMQLFMKRLRQAIRPTKIRFFLCGEYGEQLARPHYHVCIFGWFPPDARSADHYSSRKDNPTWTSAIVAKAWPHGFHLIGQLQSESMAYTARYSMKKINGDLQASHYAYIDPLSGAHCTRVPEFALMSTSPGIGSAWYDKYKSDLYPLDHAVRSNGQVGRVPAYYDKKLKDPKPELLEELKFKRGIKAVSRFENNTDERLAVREVVHQAKSSQLKRSYECSSPSFQSATPPFKPSAGRSSCTPSPRPSAPSLMK